MAEKAEMAQGSSRQRGCWSIFAWLSYSRAGGSPHSPLLMGEVSKFAGGYRPKRLCRRELDEFDSVKIVSMLVDVKRGRREKEERRADGTAETLTAKNAEN